MPKRSDWPLALFLIVVAAIWMARGTHFHNIDMMDVLYPYMSWFMGELKQGRFPLWNPLVGAGHNAVVWAHVPINQFTPIFLLLGVSGPAVTAVLFLSLFWLGSGLRTICREMGVSSHLATSVALVYMALPLVGQYVFHFVHINNIIFLPGLLILSREFARTPTLVSASKLALLGGVAMFGTKGELWMFTLAFTAFSVWYWKKTGRDWRFWAALLSILTCTVLLALPQIVVVADTIRSSNRVDGASSLANNDLLSIFDYLLNNSYSILALVVLALFGARRLVGRLSNYPALLVGSVMVLFFILRSDVSFSAIDFSFFLAAVVISERGRSGEKWGLLVSLATSWIWLNHFQTFYPFERMVGYTAMYPWLHVFTAISVIGFWRHSHDPWVRYAALGIIAITLCRVHFQLPWYRLAGIIWHPSRDNAIYYLFLAIPFAKALQDLSSLTFGVLRFRPDLMLIGAACAFSIQYLFFNSDFIKSSKHTAFGVSEGGGLKNLLGVTKIHNTRSLPVPSGSDFQKDPWTAEFPLNPNVLQYFGLPDATFYDSTPSKLVADLVNYFNEGDHFDPSNKVVNHWFPTYLLKLFPESERNLSQEEAHRRYSYMRLVPRRYDERLLDLFNVSHLIFTAPAGSEKYESWFSGRRPHLELKGKIAFDSAKASGEFHVYQRSAKTGYARFIPEDSVARTSSGTSCLKSLWSTCNSIREFVLIEGEVPESPRRCDTSAPREVSTTYSDAGTKELLVETGSRGVLLLSEAFNHNWRVTVNGQSRSTFVANCSFLGIKIEPGRSLIKLKYEPAYWMPSLWLAGMTWLGLILAILWGVVFRGRFHGDPKKSGAGQKHHPD